jgi:hypothetical protein
MEYGSVGSLRMAQSDRQDIGAEMLALIGLRRLKQVLTACREW